MKGGCLSVKGVVSERGLSMVSEGLDFLICGNPEGVVSEGGLILVRLIKIIVTGSLPVVCCSGVSCKYCAILYFIYKKNGVLTSYCHKHIHTWQP